MFGMIYKEYRDEYYYFDLLKLLMRLVLIVIINALELSHRVAMMTVVLILYYIVSLRKHPFIYY
jgi:uncharacterized membrane protein YhaH (DUF805 family)